MSLHRFLFNQWYKYADVDDDYEECEWWERYPHNIHVSTFTVIGVIVIVLALLVFVPLVQVFVQYDLLMGIAAALFCLSGLFFFIGFWLLLLGTVSTL